MFSYLNRERGSNNNRKFEGYSMWTGRLQPFLLTFLGYASIHCMREGWSFSKAQISQQFGVPMATLGWVDALFLFAYTAGMALLGSLAHLLPLKFYVIFGLTASCTAYMSFSILYEVAALFSLAFVFLAMVAAGFFQSTARPGQVAIMGNWFGEHKNALVMGLWSTNANCGNIFSLVLCNLLDQAGYNWSANFLSTGLVTLAVVNAQFFLLHDKPNQPQRQAKPMLASNNPAFQSEPSPSDQAGAPKGTSDLIADSEGLSGSNNQQSNGFKYGIFSALCLPNIPLCVVAYACLKAAVYGLLFWLPTFCEEKGGAIERQKGYISSMIDVGSLVSGLVVGWLADRYHHRRMAVLCPLLLLCAVAMFLISFLLTDVVAGYYLMMLLVGVLIGGPYNLIGTVTAIEAGKQLNDPGSVAKISSLIEGSAALLTAIEMVAIPHIEFNHIFYLFASLCLLAHLAMLPLALRDCRNSKKQPQQLAEA